MIAEKWVAEELARRGMTQKEIGAVLGRSKGTTSKMVNGHRRITGDDLLTLMRFFGYPTPMDDTPIARIMRVAASLDEPRRTALAEHLESLLPPASDPR